MLPADFYLGWVIQPVPGGFSVYDRCDRRYPEWAKVGTYLEALAYIEEQVRGFGNVKD